MKSRFAKTFGYSLSPPSAPPVGFTRQWLLSRHSGQHFRLDSFSRHREGLSRYEQTRSFTYARSINQVASSTRSYDTPASQLNQDVTTEEKNQYDDSIAKHSKQQQIRTPWHREESQKPPVTRLRQASAMTKGKLLTTPTRLFKLILPLTTRDHNDDRKTVEPLALLVHPSQPLSYLERLIQSELPLLKKDNREKIPDVNFRAIDAMIDETEARGQDLSKEEAEEEAAEDSKTGRSADSDQPRALDEHDGKEDAPHTHPRSNDAASAGELRGGPGEGGVESYSEHTEHDAANFVRWSKSTEIGDFIRDASRGKDFAVEIEGAPSQIMVGVPTFGDRTYYLRLRLRKKAGQIAGMADIKKECDLAAHNYSQNIAKAGFGGMCAWGGVVAWLTFETDLGWDVMEPVTYLVGLAGLLGGYAWFLANNREASYRSAMNLTVSRRQARLYEARGFDLNRYNYLVDEGNQLRKEIMSIASEYDVDWDEKRDAKDERVIEALKENREEKKKKAKKDDDEEESDD